MTTSAVNGQAPAIVSGRTRTPRILYLSPHWPHRATGASELRALNVARALQEVGDVEVIVVDGEGRPELGPRADHTLKIAYSVPVHVWPTSGLSRKLRWMLDPRIEYPHGCGVDHDAMQRVLATAKDFDIVWFSKLRTPNMFPYWAWRRSVVDVDDVPSTYEQSILRNQLSVKERLATYVRLQSWKRRDQLLGTRFTVLCVCSEVDKQYLQSLGVKAPMHVIPNGSDRPATAPVRNRATPPRIGFMGIFDYPPNVEGVRWFARECWPRIKRAVPDARLRLVGRDTDKRGGPEGPDIDALGWVSDVAPEVATWAAMIVPIQIGAGTRGKISHAFSLKCPVVSTSLGAYGYDVKHDDVIHLADSAEEFAEACIRVIKDPPAGEAMAERAWRAFLERWTWDAIRPRIRAAAEECLRISAVPDSDVTSIPEKSLSRA